MLMQKIKTKAKNIAGCDICVKNIARNMTGVQYVARGGNICLLIYRRVSLHLFDFESCDSVSIHFQYIHCDLSQILSILL